jgi:uncharacterized UBP type Zn finger protein
MRRPANAISGQPRRWAPECEHLAAIVAVSGRPQPFCEDCLADARGITLWVCLTCGKVGCAEGSAPNHAAEHYAETDHPIAAVLGADPPSRWCYPDQRFV